MGNADSGSFLGESTGAAGLIDGGTLRYRSASSAMRLKMGADTGPPKWPLLPCGESSTTRIVTAGSFDGRNPTNDANVSFE